MKSLYDEFLAISRELAGRFHAAPTLFGSLGLQLRLDVDLSPDDIE